jgi:hypothetical protein
MFSIDQLSIDQQRQLLLSSGKTQEIPALALMGTDRYALGHSTAFYLQFCRFNLGQ